MPKYRVKTDQGTFNVELDSEPSTPEQLQELVNLHFAGKAMDETKAYQQQEFNSAANEEPAAMVKNAVEPARPRTFTGHLAKEATEGVQGIKSGIMPEPTGSPTLDAFFRHPAVRVGRAGLGALQTLGSPVTAAARAAADYTGGNLAEKLAPKIGDIPAAAVGTAVGTPIEFLLSGGGSLGKQVPSLTRLLPGGIAGKAASIAEQAGKGILKRLPGSQAAQMEAAIDETRGALAGKTDAATSRARELQSAVSAIPEGERTPLNKTLEAIKEIITDETTHGIQDRGLLHDAERLREVIRKSSGEPSLQWIDKELSRIGEKTKAVKGVEANPAYKKLFGAMASDLEEAGTAAIKKPVPIAAEPTPRVLPSSDPNFVGRAGAKGERQRIADILLEQRANKAGRTVEEQRAIELANSPAAGAPIEKPPMVQPPIVEAPPVDNLTPKPRYGKMIRDRDKALREQFGWEDLTDEFNKLVRGKKGMEGAEDVNTAHLMNKLKRKEFLMDSLNPSDWKDIEVIFKKIADMPALPPPKGVMAGSYRALTTGGGGAALATLLGADPTTAGIVGGGLMALERASMTLLPSRVGRKLVRSVLESGPINKEGIDMLTAAANAADAAGNSKNEVGNLFRKKAANQ